MPTVPFPDQRAQASPRPQVAPTFLMAAAADLHAAGQLVEPNPAVPDEGRYHDEEDLDESNRAVKLPPEPKSDPEIEPTKPTKAVG